MFDLHLLGPFRLLDDTGESRSLRDSKARCMLAFLAFSPEGAESRGEMRAHLWSDRSEQQAQTSLRQSLVKLRDSLAPNEPPVLHRDATMLRLDFERIRVDARQLIDAHNLEQLTQHRPLEQWTGGLLADTRVRDPVFEHWVSSKQELLRLRLIQLVSDALRDAVAASDWREVNKLAINLLELDEADEQAYRALIEASFAQGKPAEALGHLDQLKRHLQTALGATASAETTELVERLLAATDRPTSAASDTRLAETGSSPQTNAPPVAARASARPPGIAVLPFENLSRDEDQQYFCDGLSIDITTDLSKFQRLLVMSPTSTFRYKDALPDPRQIGQELGVRYLLRGSVQRVAGHVRVNVELIDSASGVQIWAERFNRPLGDVFEVQEEIIQLVVSRLSVRVNAHERREAMHKTRSLSAYDAFLRSNQYWTTYLDSGQSMTQLEESVHWLRIALELDPDFARASSNLGYMLIEVWLNSAPQEALVTEAEQCTRRAVELAPFDYDILWSHAYVLLHTGRIEQAERTYQQALELNGNDADLLVEIAELNCYLGRYEETERLLAEALRLNPLVPDWYHMDVAWSYCCQERYDEALAELERVTETGFDYHVIMSMALANTGRVEAASRQVRLAMQYRPAWCLEMQSRIAPFNDRLVAGRWLGALEQAGLPSRAST